MRHLAVACCLALTTTAANAGDRLFPTDAPRSGEFEGAFGLGYSKAEDDSGPTTLESDVLLASFGTRFGLGAGFALGASVPYILGGETCFGSICAENDKELGSVNVGIDWELTAGSSGPISALLSVTYDTDSADYDSESFTIDLTAAAKVADDVRSYVSVERFLPQWDFATEAWTAELGAHIGSGSRVAPEIFYQRTDDDLAGAAFTTLGASLSVIVEGASNTRFIPGVFYQQSEYDGTDAFDTWGVQVTIYGLGGETRPVRRTRAVAPKPAAAVAAAPAPAAPVNPVATPTRTAPPVLQAGPYTLPKLAGLCPRPRTDAVPDATLAAGANVMLKTRVVNEFGPWWFVEEGERRGWVREAELR